jgi:uncharacterized protein YjbI with pentapeptide repeats
MLSIFEAGKSDPEEGWVDGFVIDGNDVMRIIDKTNYDIKIKNSVIKGGLNFISFPIRKVVPNGIDIHDTDIDSIVLSFPFDTLFIKPVIFAGVTFSGKADFSGAKFNAMFMNAKFNGDVYFTSATFNGDVDFSKATFSGAINFTSATFNGDVDFSRAIFIGDTEFFGVTFNGNVHFKGTTFNGNADFYLATVSGNAAFDGALFQKAAYFRYTTFLKILSLDLIKIKEYADFRDATINQLRFYSKVNPVIIESNVDFRKSKITEAHFEDIIFEKDVDFSDATFGCTVFKFITFQSDASFIRTDLHGWFALERVNFKKEANFTGADFKGSSGKNQERFSLSYVNFHNLILNWEQLPHPNCWIRASDGRIQSFVDLENAINAQDAINALKEATGNTEGEESKEEPLQPLSEVLKDLETNFRKSGQLYDANEAYFFSKEAELQEASSEFFWRKVSRWLEWFGWGIWAGYGVRIWRVISWCVAFNLLFTFAYFLGKPARKFKVGGERDFSFKPGILESPRNFITTASDARTKNDALKRLWDSFCLSVVVLFRFGYRDITISGRLFGVKYKYIVWTEWSLGFPLLAFFVITLSNTQPILNKLISAVPH